MARVTGAMFSVFCTGKFGKVITYKRRKGVACVGKKIVHVGRLTDNEKRFARDRYLTSLLARARGFDNAFVSDPAFGFGFAEEIS